MTQDVEFQKVMRKKIFMPGITSKPKGIGMGLVIATEIVKQYDGEIAVRIPGDLEGATFILELKERGIGK